MDQKHGERNQQTFGKTLSEIRRALNLRQQDIAESIGVSDSAISQYEACKRVPRQPLFDRLTAVAKSIALQKPPVVQTRVLNKLGSLGQLYAPPVAGRHARVTSLNVKHVREPIEPSNAQAAILTKRTSPDEQILNWSTNYADS